jgi:uncharacterized protein with HEPN domain
VKRRDNQRLADILAATDAITSHVNRGGLDDGLIFDAVRVRDVAAMRNHLAHRYFDTAHGIVKATIGEDLPPLLSAVRRLLDHLAAN